MMTTTLGREAKREGGPEEMRRIMGKVSIFDEARKEGRSILTEFESKRILKKMGIPVVETRLAKTAKEPFRLPGKWVSPWC